MLRPLCGFGDQEAEGSCAYSLSRARVGDSFVDVPSTLHRWD